MRRVRNPWVRGLIVWSLVLLIVTIVVAFEAISSLYEAQQICFFGTAPCPEPGGPKEVQLAVAFVVMPLVWLTGLVIGIGGWALAGRSHRPRR